jgi:hypothetical protein
MRCCLMKGQVTIGGLSNQKRDIFTAQAVALIWVGGLSALGEVTWRTTLTISRPMTQLLKRRSNSIANGGR